MPQIFVLLEQLCVIDSSNLSFLCFTGPWYRPSIHPLSATHHFPLHLSQLSFDSLPLINLHFEQQVGEVSWFDMNVGAMHCQFGHLLPAVGYRCSSKWSAFSLPRTYCRFV